MTVAVQVNTLLLDGAKRGLKELDLLKNSSITVPDTVLNFKGIQAEENTGGINPKVVTDIKNLINAEIQRKLTDCMMWILPRKRRYSSKLPKMYN